MIMSPNSIVTLKEVRNVANDEHFEVRSANILNCFGWKYENCYADSV
jgi:hypothetical protein